MKKTPGTVPPPAALPYRPHCDNVRQAVAQGPGVGKDQDGSHEPGALQLWQL